MILVLIPQFVVCILIMRWVLKQKPGEKYSKGSVGKFFLFGGLATVLSFVFSMVFSLERDSFFHLNPFLGGFLTALITAALLEEISKYILFRIAIMKNAEVGCWLDVIIASTVVGIGFTLVEDVTYAVFGDGNIIRALLPMHILFQIIMGYFYGKALVTKKFKYHVLSLAVPILAHTLFDMFSISLRVILQDKDMEELGKLSNEEFMQLPYMNELAISIAGMAVVSIAALVALIVMLKKIGIWSKNGEKQERLSEGNA